MDEIINIIIKQNESLFGTNPSVNKINIGFTNTIYNVNDSFIIKICTDINNESKFKKEIEFYNSNKTNTLIPKLYYSNIGKEEVPYLYEILEKIEGVSLYNVWHTLTEEQREDIIKQICDAMKQMHSVKGETFNWIEYNCNKFSNSYVKVKELFNEEERNKIEQAYLLFDKYLDSNEFVLIHNDLHFDNIFINNGKIKIIDFERSMYAPKDFELDIIYRMIRMPWKFASEETEDYTDVTQYQNIMMYIAKYYPELTNTQNLYKRLAIYDIVYYLNQLIRFPNVVDLKEGIMSSVDILLS